MTSVLIEELDELHDALEGDRLVRMSARRLLLKKSLQRGIKTGDPKVIRFFAEHDRREQQTPSNTDLQAQQDAKACEAVMAAFKPAAPPAALKHPAAQDKPSAAVEPSKDCEVDEQLLLPFPEE